VPTSTLARILVLLSALAAARSAGAQAPNPDFDAVSWAPLGCDASPLTAATPRGEVDLVGDAVSAAVYTAFDATYLYFRYRVNGDPSGPRGFAGSSNWNMLVQVPSGSAFQYQYQLALNGDGQGGDTVEVWGNSVPADLTFSPLFTDEPDVRLFRQVYSSAGPTTVNTTPLARWLPTPGLVDATDYFVDVAFPIAVLAANGLQASDLPGALFFPATATLPDRHNRDHLLCPFLPSTTLAVEAAVAPGPLRPGTTTRVRYTFAVHDTGGADASGTILGASGLPAFLANLAAAVAGDGPDVTGTVVSTNPLEVRVPRLPPGRTATVTLDADATPTCTDTGTTAVVALRATNADAVSGTVSLQVDTTPGTEVCDGLDNNCDGRTDEGGDALCDDGNPCNGAERCGGAAGCLPGPICDDGDACTTDTCDAVSGCAHTPIPDCARCTTVAECNDADGCTTDGCSGGRCIHAPVIDCRRCTTVAECVDANPCTDDVCGPEGVCLNVPRAGCRPCTVPADCADADPCTVDQCGADGICIRIVLQGCCSTSAQCDDGKQCTQDLCAGNVCAHPVIPGCTECTPAPEVCDDGIDDDCDGLADCADPDCAAVAACVAGPTERCDDCRDDDGDGLVDYEDPDCCAVAKALGVGRLTLRPPAVRRRGNRLRLEAQYAGTTPPLFDPLRQDTSIQLSDASGPVLCTTIQAQRWRRLRRLSYRFADRAGAFAGGLEAGEFHINRNGTLVFRARGRDVGVRAIDGGSVRLTIRVGNDCSRSSMALRAGRNGLVFP
jgi:hypothetical protein